MLKRLLGILCLILIFSNACASVCLRMDSGAALVTAGGETIVPVGEYGDIVSLGGGLFAAQGEAGYALMDETGSILGGEEYAHIENGPHAIIAEKDGLLGLIDQNGQRKSEFKYTAITADESGMCWALYGSTGSAMGRKLYLLTGNEADTETDMQLLSIGKTAYQGLLSARTTDGKYGYIDRSGRMILEAQYQYASDFVNGCAAAAMNGCFGAIDTSGAFVVPAEYDFLEISEYGYIIAAQSTERVAVFDMQGGLVDEYFGENISIALVGSYYTVCDDISLRVYSSGHEILFEVPPYASVYEGIGGQLLVSNGIFGENCVRIYGTEHAYQNLYPLGVFDGEAVYAAVAINAVKYENHMLDEIQYSLDMNSVRCGAVDSQGEVLLESEYISLEPVGENRLLVRTDTQWQMIDILGRVYWSQEIRTEASGE